MANKKRKTGALLMATTLVGTAAGTMTSSNTASASFNLLNKIRNSWNATGDKLFSAVDDAFEAGENTLSLKIAKVSLKTVAALAGTIGFICHFTFGSLAS